MKPTLYTLPHGIEVVGEYPPRQGNRYWRVRIRPHRFFPGLKVVGGGCYIRKSRAVMASLLGRPLRAEEHVHHRNEDREDDRPENLALIDPATHNTHHKTGTTHSVSSKSRISAGLRKAYREQRHPRPVIANRNHKGQIAP